MRGDDLKSCPEGVGTQEKQPISFRILSFQVTKKKKKKTQTGLIKTGNLELTISLISSGLEPTSYMA